TRGRAGHAGERIVTIEKPGQPDYRPETSSAASGPSAKPSGPSTTNGLAADDADDQPVSADDADDPLTNADETIISGNPLQNIGSDGADDEWVLCSEEKVGAENPDDMLTYVKADGDLDGSLDRRSRKRCNQCRGTPDGKEQPYPHGGTLVWLHSECRPYWLK